MSITVYTQYMSPVKRICVFEHSVMTNFNRACPAIQRGHGSGFYENLLESIRHFCSALFFFQSRLPFELILHALVCAKFKVANRQGAKRPITFDCQNQNCFNFTVKQFQRQIKTVGIFCLFFKEFKIPASKLKRRCHLDVVIGFVNIAHLQLTL